MSKSGKCSPLFTFERAIERMPEEISYFAEASSSSITSPGRVSLVLTAGQRDRGIPEVVWGYGKNEEIVFDEN